ncbi:MAG: pilus assembly protein N-terminal domain-containing protein [Deltaproteobacteria bacterium]|nr:pilus assembly protein N-terminal domain-containing protein [Deltaproteobacteria bacterium]
MAHSLLPRALAVAVVLAVAAPAYPQDDNSTIAIGVGTQKVLSIPGIARIAIGDPGIADVKPINSSQLLIVGQAEGGTTLLIWKSNGSRLSYLIRVRKKDPNEVIEEIKKLLGDREGITVRMVGDRIFLDGYAYTTDDADRVNQIATLYAQVKSFVKVAPNAKKLVANNLNAALQRAGLKNVQANVVGTTLFLEGSVESQQDLQKAELITKAIGESVENLLVVGIKRMVLTEVQFVEIRRKNEDNIGIKWPLDIKDGNATASLTFNKPDLLSDAPATMPFTFNVTGKSDFAFGLMFNDGYGRLLAQPKLVCASGEKAEFLAGGELPIPLITNNQATVEFKPFGVKLNIRPTADRHGNIQTEIEAEVSKVDRAVTVSFGGITIPGFATRRVKTSVTVRHGETIVLSGIFEHDEDKSVAKFPLLGHIPIIGELFKNRGFSGQKRELVVFVTPRIVNPDTERIRKLIDDIKMRYKQARDEVTFGIFD